jgi:hypothetical protein
MSEAKIVIDEEFKNLIQAMPPDVVEGLEMAIIRDGCLDPLKVWDKDGELILLDGHHRLEICERNNIEYQTSTIELASREEAINWIIDNQLSRRNLNEIQIDYLLGKRLENEKKQGARTDLTSRQSDAKSKTAAKIAKQSGKSQATIERNEQLAKALDEVRKDNPDFVKKVLGKTISIPKKAVMAISKMELADRKEAIKEVEAGTFKLPKAESEQVEEHGPAVDTVEPDDGEGFAVLKYKGGIEEFQRMDEILKLFLVLDVLEGMERSYEYNEGDDDAPPWSKCSLINNHRMELLDAIDGMRIHVERIKTW